MHDYASVFRAPTWTSQHDPDAEHEEQVRRVYRARLVRMLREHDETDAADLVSIAPVDERW